MSELSMKLFAGKRYRIEVPPYPNPTHQYVDTFEEVEEIFSKDKDSSKIEVWCDKINWWSIADKDGNCYWCEEGGHG